MQSRDSEAIKKLANFQAGFIGWIIGLIISGVGFLLGLPIFIYVESILGNDTGWTSFSMVISALLTILLGIYIGAYLGTKYYGKNQY